MATLNTDGSASIGGIDVRFIGAIAIMFFTALMVFIVVANDSDDEADTTTTTTVATTQDAGDG